MWSVAGQDHIVRMLEQALQDGTLAHAYLIVGPPHAGKGTLAQELAQAVNCETSEARPCKQCHQCQRIAAGRHADVVVLGVEEAEGHKAVLIEQARDALRMAGLQPYEGTWRVFIIDGAEFLNEASANALLKTLEEPPPNVLWLLLAVDEERLPPTIRSRCQRLALRPLAHEEIARLLQGRWDAPPEQARFLARLAKGSLGWAVKALQDSSVLEARTRTLDRLAGMASATLEERFGYAGELASLIPRERAAVREVLELWASWWRDILLLSMGISEAVWNLDRLEELRQEAIHYRAADAAAFVDALLQAKRLLDMNVNPRLALEHLMLRVPSSAPVA